MNEKVKCPLSSSTLDSERKRIMLREKVIDYLIISLGVFAILNVVILICLIVVLLPTILRVM